MNRERVEVVEVGLRDGLQMLPIVVPTAEKLRWLSAEQACGVKRFEVASFVPVKNLPQMADAAAVVKASLGISKIHVAALAPNMKGAIAASEAGADIIVMPVSASEAHSSANVRKTPDEMVAEVGRVAMMRRETGLGFRLEAGIATAFGCTLQGAVSEDEVVRLSVAAVEAGADEIGLADTVGYATPGQVRRLFGKVRDAVGDRVNSAHFHDTRGTGLANVVAALDTGIRSFDSSLGGLGGCPFAPGASGNIATEDLVYMLESMGLDTGINLDQLIETQRMLTEILPGQTFFSKMAHAGLPLTYRENSHAA
ncbi:hydroxymethylglutaryl-CoA lyase [Phyllobacterium sophorae]|uniref:Hydroxymethylglutaryl-CoA lyase n=1 Tax=Phyllobacterium sophorae TaxID=1520277 RepID=A0A2P7B6M5_9HYPH|nr:hydroxymethylglutaryl-CoA lyase [Phyllobacterium sophorae]PSH62108.1 hydroxymethylglutaryl-CoA lyase [Phyllobacterium sophorae]